MYSNEKSSLFTFFKCLFLKKLLLLIYLIKCSENADTRFNSLKLFTDILIQYLNEEAVYDLNGSKPSAKIINEIIIKKLLPNIEYILNNQDPIPLYGLKLFSIIFGKNSQFIVKIKQDKTINIFLDYFNSTF